jgi:hypothetical protein
MAATTMPTSHPSTTPMTVPARIGVAIGLLLHLGVGFLVVASGLIMPGWAVVLLAVVWLLGLGLAVHWRRRPTLVLLVPVGMATLWFATAWAGETLLGWTA